jgi:hypothetical protein
MASADNKIDSGSPFGSEEVKDDKQGQVAVKILKKQNIIKSSNGIRNLVREIVVHWILQECSGFLKLLELYEDSDYVFLVLEYQAEGDLLGPICKKQ